MLPSCASSVQTEGSVLFSSLTDQNVAAVKNRNHRAINPILIFLNFIVLSSPLRFHTGHTDSLYQIVLSH